MTAHTPWTSKLQENGLTNIYDSFGVLIASFMNPNDADAVVLRMNTKKTPEDLLMMIRDINKLVEQITTIVNS